MMIGAVRSHVPLGTPQRSTFVPSNKRDRTPCAWSALTFGSVLISAMLVLLGMAWAEATPLETEVRGQLAGLRVPFIANQGQVDAPVAYYAPVFAGTLFITRQGELVYSLRGRTVEGPDGRSGRAAGPGWTLTETLVADPVHPAGQDRSDTGISYFIGNDPARWRPAVAAYDQVSLGEVWPGVSVIVRARAHSAEKVFTVSPGSSVEPSAVLASSRPRSVAARAGTSSTSWAQPIRRFGSSRSVSGHATAGAPWLPTT
jgi:hypothetical protein